MIKRYSESEEVFTVSKLFNQICLQIHEFVTNFKTSMIFSNERGRLANCALLVGNNSYSNEMDDAVLFPEPSSPAFINKQSFIKLFFPLTSVHQVYMHILDVHWSTWYLST